MFEFLIVTIRKTLRRISWCDNRIFPLIVSENIILFKVGVNFIFVLGRNYPLRTKKFREFENKIH